MAAGKTSARAERLLAIKLDIAAHLDRHDLSLEWLSARHGIRPRQIQNLFYAEGSGFSAFLLEARLARARALLADPANATRTIIQIAAMSGFGDISWFNNVFRRRFGMTPGMARLASPEGAGGTSATKHGEVRPTSQSSA